MRPPQNPAPKGPETPPPPPPPPPSLPPNPFPTPLTPWYSKEEDIPGQTSCAVDGRMPGSQKAVTHYRMKSKEPSRGPDLLELISSFSCRVGRRLTSTGLQRPKSDSFMWPRTSSNRLSGLMSLQNHSRRSKWHVQREVWIDLPPGSTLKLLPPGHISSHLSDGLYSVAQRACTINAEAPSSRS